MPNGEHAERIAVTETLIRDLRGDICRVETKQENAAVAAQDAHELLLGKIHSVDKTVTGNAVTLKMWGSVLAGLILLAGVATPVVVALLVN